MSWACEILKCSLITKGAIRSHTWVSSSPPRLSCLASWHGDSIDTDLQHNTASPPTHHIIYHFCSGLHFSHVPRSCRDLPSLQASNSTCLLLSPFTCRVRTSVLMGYVTFGKPSSFHALVVLKKLYGLGESVLKSDLSCTSREHEGAHDQKIQHIVWQQLSGFTFNWVWIL